VLLVALGGAFLWIRRRRREEPPAAKALSPEEEARLEGLVSS